MEPSRLRLLCRQERREGGHPQGEFYMLRGGVSRSVLTCPNASDITHLPNQSQTHGK